MTSKICLLLFGILSYVNAYRNLLCYTRNCQNGATCDGYWGCVCTAGYTGKLCENSLSGCKNATQDCHPKASCVKTNGSSECQCLPGYNGDGRSTCKVVDRCLETPCQNAGICSSNATNFNCRCLLGYSGPLCEKKCEQQKMDILLIEDVSSSISEEEYRTIKDFEIEMVSYAHINSSIVNVALMVYAGKARLVFPLNAYSGNKTEAVNAVNVPQLVGGSTFLGDAINMAVSDVFVKSNGDRPDAENVVILFTDGKSSKKSAIVKNIGRLLTEAAVYVVPISSDTDMVDIGEVASAPDEEHVFSMSNPLALDEIKKRTIYEHCGRDVALKE